MKPIQQPTGGAGALVALSAFLLAPWALRALALVEEGSSPDATDLRGFAADLAVAGLAMALTWPLARLWRGLAALAAAALALLAAANYQTIAALGSVASLGDAHFLTDRTFLLGSVLAASRPWLMGALVVASAGLGWLGLPRLAGRGALTGGVAGLVLLAGVVLAPDDRRSPDWRTVNVVQHNARAWVLGARQRPAWSDPRRAMLERLPELAADLDGAPRFAWTPAHRNVLLVVLEGVSGAYLEPLARRHGRAAVWPMTELERTAREGVAYATFVNHNRRTNRGLYALLCGELPSLPSGMAKMTVAATRPWQTCLPEILRREGYRTVYLQAAPLSFMVKDRFMARVGFDEIVGSRSLPRYHLRSQWGVDDRAFLDQAGDKIVELQAGGRPWFLTLLTVGTHHPYTVPPPYGAGTQRESVRGAFRYLDLAIGEFTGRLDELGVRDETLILFVSDESAGDWGRAADATSARLTQNWGFAVALLPERPRALVTDPYGQLDVAVSVLDYLGLADRGKGLFGRSLFRRYATRRHLFFANLNWRSFGAVDPTGRIVHCEYEGWRCGIWDGRDGRLFAADRQPLPPDPALERLVVDVAERSRAPQESGALLVPLVSNPRFELTGRDRQVIYGVSDLSLSADDWLEVEVEVAARGDGAAELLHFLRLRDKSSVVTGTSMIRGGETLRMRYTLAPEHRVGPLGIRSEVELREGGRLALLYRKRRFVVHRGGVRPAPGLRLERWELDPPGAASPRVVVMAPEEITAAARRLDATPDS